MKSIHSRDCERRRACSAENSRVAESSGARSRSPLWTRALQRGHRGTMMLPASILVLHLWPRSHFQIAVRGSVGVWTDFVGFVSVADDTDDADWVSDAFCGDSAESVSGIGGVPAVFSGVIGDD